MKTLLYEVNICAKMKQREEEAVVCLGDLRYAQNQCVWKIVTKTFFQSYY